MLRTFLWKARPLQQSTIVRMSMATERPIETAITEALKENLNPVYLEVVNESPMHNVPKRSESHFRVLVVSHKFDELPLLKRHRLVNQIVQQKLKDNFVHALSIEAKTPKQWDPTYKIDQSPKCLGGFGK